jgi:hypothetical protein
MCSQKCFHVRADVHFFAQGLSGRGAASHFPQKVTANGPQKACRKLPTLGRKNCTTHRNRQNVPQFRTARLCPKIWFRKWDRKWHPNLAPPELFRKSVPAKWHRISCTTKVVPRGKDRKWHRKLAPPVMFRKSGPANGTAI